MRNLIFKRQLNIVLVFFLVVNTCFYPLANGNNNSTYDTETTTFFDSANDKKENYESDENTESIVETENLTMEFNELVDTESIDESFDVSNIGDEENDLPNSNSAESENDRETERYSEKETISNNENVENSKNDEKDKRLVETEGKIETKKDEETIETDKTTTEIALETSEEKKENNIKETETHEKTESEKDSIEETEDVPEVVDEISTTSQIKSIDDDLNISSMSEIDDKIGGEVKNELSYTTLDLLDSNIWTISDDEMKLNSDITLDKPILIDKDLNIDFSNYTIDTNIDDYVFIIVDSTVSFNGGIIKGRNGDVDKPDGSDAISLINSNLTINNCNIYGGNGYTIKDLDETVGNGGSAIIARYENNDKKIIFNSGEIVGGIGGTGNVNDVQGIGGLAISGKGISSKKRINGNILDVENGLNGDIGCGNGGNAIMMFGENLSLDNILINSSGIHGGNAGLEIKNTKRKLLKKNRLGSDLPAKYNSVENGWTTSLKNQKKTNMCSTFSFCSVAETQLIKNYPDKLQKMGYEEITDIDLSEYAEHFYIFTPPVVYPDYFNSTSYIRENADISRFTDIDERTGTGTTTDKDTVTDEPLYLIDHATLNSKRLGLTTENKAPLFTGNSNTINKTDLYTMSGKDENPLALKNRVAVLKSAEMLNSNVKYPTNPGEMDTYRANMLPYINNLKSRIINSGSILLGLDPGFQVSQMEYEGKIIRVLSKSSSGGSIGHCVALVGFDDTFQNGAFIAKDSNSSEYYTYIPYDMENGNWEAMDCEFELNPTNEIVFSNDQGVAYETNHWMGYDKKNGYGVKYKIEEVVGGEEVEIEKLKAVTVMLPSNIQNLIVRIVEVEKNDETNGTPDIKEVIAEKEINAKVGLNYIDFTDVENRNLSVGKSYLVSVQKNNKFDIFIDCNDGEGKTIISPNNYVYDVDGWKRINASNADAMNPRIKLLTGIAKKAIFDANGGKYEDETTTYEDYFARGEEIKGLKVPTRLGYELLGYSEDRNSSTATLTEGSIYDYDSSEKTFYAVWKAINYTATFNANGGKYTDNTTSYEKQYTVESNINANDLVAPVRDGYEFIGYGESDTATEPITLAGQKWSYTKNKTFYAVWKAINYTATFNANGGKYADNTTSYQKQYTVESNINASDLVEPVREGYEFIGYGESDTATEPITLAEQKWSYTENKTFYAVWKEIQQETSETQTSETETTVAPTTTKASNSNNNSGGGNSGGSGGSRGGSISIANAENAMLPTTTAKQTTVEEKPIGATVMQPIDDSNSVKMTQNSVDVITTKVAWNYNDAIKKWNMIFENETSKSIEFAVNGFFKVNDNTNVDSSHLNEYVFDAYGNMITGFVSDKTGKWYFFDDVENDNIGRKVVGWRKYGENWYYFSREGVMYQDAITPDGYYVNPNGVWTNQEKVSTNTTITTTNINPAQTSTTPTSNTAAVSPAQTSTTPASNTIVVSPSNSANVSVANTDANKTAKSTSGSFGPGVMIDNAKNNAAKVIGLSNTTK